MGTKLELNEKDSAIIIREDGQWETLLGISEDPDEEVPMGAQCAAALTMVLNNESLMEELLEQVETSGIVDQIQAEIDGAADNGAPH